MVFFPKRNLKVQITLTLGLLFALAMLLQSVVVLMLEVRSTVKQEIAYTERYLTAISNNFKSITGDYDSFELLINFFTTVEQKEFSCFEIITRDSVLQSNNTCRLDNELSQLSLKAIEEKSIKIDVAGMTWALLFFRNDAVIGAMPLFDSRGELFGTIVIERSLLPVYSRFNAEGKIALVYLFVNVIIFTAIGFFRMAKILFKPIDKLVQLAEKHTIEGDVAVPMRRKGSEFWKLTASLKGMFERINADNRKLRNSVTELEKVNKELQDNKNLIIRSEKLASVGRLSAGLAHEIGNPLSIVQGYVDLLGREDLDESEKAIFSEKASFELKRINTLIRQLLDFSKPVNIPRENVHIHSLIKDLTEFVSMGKLCKNCSICLELNAEDDVVNTEKESLRQILLNCLLNSVDAMAGNSVEDRKICISTMNCVGRDSIPMIQISLQDEGTGLDSKEIENVFDPFFTTKEAGKGTGLGLFVSYSLMERLGGVISIRNREGSGAEVLLNLPILNSDYS